jgi:N-acylneuraminate cytidylyltransferase
MSADKVVAVIFARGGSKGVPRKNLRLVTGTPLIGHAIAAARASHLIDRVIVSTDDDEIAAVALSCGAEVPFMRPAELAKDDSPEWAAWQHAVRTIEQLDNQEISVLVSIPATAPLRAVEDIDACISMLLGSDADVVITVTTADRNPYFNMVTLDRDNSAHLVIRPERILYRRQDAPEVFDMTTVAFAARKEFVMRATSVFDGNVKAVVVPKERALDIDTELDLAFAEFLMTRPLTTEAE